MFQRILENILVGPKGVVNYSENIFSFGWTLEKYDENLRALVQRMEDVGLTINSQKFEFQKNEVRFIVHIGGNSSIRLMTSKIQSIKDFSALATSKGFLISWKS